MQLYGHDMRLLTVCCVDFKRGRSGQELREYWGNKASKGFAGPGLNGSRHHTYSLGPLNSQAVRGGGPSEGATAPSRRQGAWVVDRRSQGGTSTSTRSAGFGRSSQSWMPAKAERMGPRRISVGS